MNGKGWSGPGFGAGGPKNVGIGMVLGMVTVKAQSAEALARMKAAELASLVVSGTIRLQRLQTVGHPEKGQSH